jgi:hypothetical protein
MSGGYDSDMGFAHEIRLPAIRLNEGMSDDKEPGGSLPLWLVIAAIALAAGTCIWGERDDSFASPE